MTCRRFYGFYIAHDYSLLREWLNRNYTTIDIHRLQCFPAERVLRNGRTLLCFPKPKAGRFTICLIGDVLTIDEAEKAVVPLPYYHSATRDPDELSDDD